jgi:hypothetical protein
VTWIAPDVERSEDYPARRNPSAAPGVAASQARGDTTAG